MRVESIFVIRNYSERTANTKIINPSSKAVHVYYAMVYMDLSSQVNTQGCHEIDEQSLYGGLEDLIFF